ncbi:hypothetical protein TIFTF001_035090 [Ficus carica]|uniref:Uncharacterized protein n=1 Tax=Ficus carica TaxID=3494 RepID=A0AA88E1C2_FICCA|nr:hypothetical protein TIFTF001_035090 [Ficus carica]
MSGRRFYTLRPTASIVGPIVTHGSAYYSVLTREFPSERQKVGTPIKEHMMKVMAYLSEAQTNGAEIDSATQLVMVFQTLSKDFDLYQASYNLNRKEMSLTELMKELQAFENIFKGSGSMAEEKQFSYL